jgi:tetratricopeptide (TPR) repeat protein
MDAHLFLAECLLNKQDLVNVRKVLDEANRPGAMAGRFSVLQPRHAELWAIYGLALLEGQQLGKAEEACNTALQIDSRNLRATANLGSIRMAQGHLEEAEGWFRRLVADHPKYDNARLLLITCLTRKGNLDLADQEIATVIQQEPTSFSVHKSVMGSYYSRGRWAEYRAEIERFRKVDPTSAHLDFEQSFVDLLFGDMLQGWERYEARFKVPKEWRLKQRTFAQPAWNGESFPGKTLLLWAEQGFGDTLMFIRYLPLVKALGGQVILRTQPALVDVAATCRGVDGVFPEKASLPPFDLQASLMSLPALFRTELSSVPAEIPYLDVPTEVPHRQAILELLTQAQGNTRIGLVWAGSPGHVRDDERSLSATSLAPLAELPGVTWFSFQLGRLEVPPLPSLVSLAPFLKNFSATAYALSGMDLVITVDTSVAHLAGALGIPTLLLLAFQPDFRWMLDRDDSPWYPTLRLYRQPAYGDWESVIRQVVGDLTQDA